MIKQQKYIGKEIEGIFEPLAKLRIQVFRDFPYLYEGNLAYELEYLATYSNAERGMVLGLWEGTELVGATTCIPLENETQEVQAPFLQASIPIASVFYFGESILQKQHRGKGYGKLFFEERENHAAQFPEIQRTCFCAVVRPDDHPQKPIGYQALDGFWLSRGYRKSATLVSSFDWPDIGEAENSRKEMVYWMKDLNAKST